MFFFAVTFLRLPRLTVNCFKPPSDDLNLVLNIGYVGGHLTAKCVGGHLTAKYVGGHHTAKYAGGHLTAKYVGGHLTAK